MLVQLPNMLINVPDEFGKRAIKEQWSEKKFLYEWTIMRIHEQMDKIIKRDISVLPKPRIWNQG